MSKVLVVHPGALGDFIISLPSIYALTRAGFTVDVAVRHPGRGLVDIIPFIQSAFDLEFFMPRPRGQYKIAFIFGISLDPSPFKRISEEVFMGPPVKGGRRWKVMEYFERVKKVVPVDFPKELRFSISWKGGKYATIHPGSGSREKNWRLESFLNVARYIRSLGFTPLFLLGPPEEGMRERIEREGFRALFSKPIVEVAHILSSSALYLGNDSGITHLAAALGVPTLVIFKKTDPRIWRPFGPRVHVIDLRHRFCFEQQNGCQG